MAFSIRLERAYCALATSIRTVSGCTHSVFTNCKGGKDGIRWKGFFPVLCHIVKVEMIATLTKILNFAINFTRELTLFLTSMSLETMRFNLWLFLSGEEEVVPEFLV